MTDIRGLPPIMVGEPDPGVALGVEEGLLCQLLHSPEFNLFPNSAVFESNFIQVTKTEDCMDIEDRTTTVVLGVTSSVPSLPLPNIFLMAKVTWPQEHLSTYTKSIDAPKVTLSRILPLKFVEITISDKSKRILRVRTVTEKIYYMKLHPKHPEAVFHFWIRLVNILQEGLSITTKDPRINVNHCLVPKTPSTILLQSAKPSESLVLLMTRTHGTFSDLSLDFATKQDQSKSTLNSSKMSNRSKIKEDTENDSGDDRENQDNWDFQLCSGYNSNAYTLPSTPLSGRPWWKSKNTLDFPRCYQAYYSPDATMVIRGLPPAAKEPDPGVGLGVEEGLLCQLLHSPEFNLFPNSAVFESNFIQVTKYNNWRNIYDTSTTVALGVTSSVACLPLPNILLMAKVQWPKGQSPKWISPIETPIITLKRILPLKFVELQVCDWSQRILRIRTVTEKIYYLKLHLDHPEVVFQFWIRLLHILERGLSITTKDPTIHVSHCQVPKDPCKSSEDAPEKIDISRPAGPSESLILLMARGMSETSDFHQHKKTSRNKDANIMGAIKVVQKRSPEQELSSQESIQRNKEDLCLRDYICHSLWERENPSGPQPLSLLSTLAASTCCFGPQP